MKKFAVVVLLAAIPFDVRAAGRADAMAAVAGAVQAENAAAKLGNRWVPAEASLKAAQAALAAGTWNTAVAEASKARSLAERAVEQSHEQEKVWREAVIR